MNFNRRTFLKAASGATALPLLGHVRNARAATSRVVVVGGGFAGATAAKYVAQWGGPGVSVSLVEPDATHVSCILSNLVLNDRVKYSALGFNHSTLHQRYG
ncbi:MAG: FAD-dependent oxidoreductase, partial [Methyloversatilis sp.]|nr:FAD-dependent oxidoreductase [Methyloversatilis sp.]